MHQNHQTKIWRNIWSTVLDVQSFQSFSIGKNTGKNSWPQEGSEELIKPLRPQKLNQYANAFEKCLPPLENSSHESLKHSDPWFSDVFGWFLHHCLNFCGLGVCQKNIWSQVSQGSGQFCRVRCLKERPSNKQRSFPPPWLRQ